MVKLENVTKKYSNTPVFENFSFIAEEGKITCVLGESGSGKTTLLSIIAGLTKAEGNVNAPESAVVFQKPNLFPNMTVKENLMLINKDEERVKAILTEFSLFDKINAYPKHLSGGQAQRVALCRALLFDKPLLLLDEPSASLDLALKYFLLDKIKEHHKNTKNTVIMVTHDIKEAVSLADRICVLSKGKIVYDAPVNEKTEEELFSVMLNLKK